MLPTELTVPLEHWEAPVFHAMQVYPTFAWVPMEFFVGDVLGSFAVAWFWWPALLLGALLYGIALLGTWIEPRWLGILWEYVSYHTAYEA